MSIAIVTGAAGLVGSACVRELAERGHDVVGIDNDMRAQLFGPEASTTPTRLALERSVPRYRHEAIDVRDEGAVARLFGELGTAVTGVIHCAGQPSHDWSASHVQVDFDINARATVGLLEAARTHCPSAPFVFMSTNKVYGDTPNRLPLVERESRFELPQDHGAFEHGLDESTSLEATMRSPYGAGKLGADVMVQEYGRYFGMSTVCLRAGCITGPAHAGTQLHGFLAYLVRCAVEDREYSVVGYGGKQVRDNLHAADLGRICARLCESPRPGAEVYNVGGGRGREVSIREAIAAIERLTGRPMRTRSVEAARRGDHVWYVTDMRKLHAHHDGTEPRRSLSDIFEELHAVCVARTRT